MHLLPLWQVSLNIISSRYFSSKIRNNVVAGVATDAVDDVVGGVVGMTTTSIDIFAYLFKWLKLEIEGGLKKYQISFK